MKNSNFEDIFRESGEHDRGFEFQESSWDDLEKRLEQPKKRRRFLWIWFLFPAALATGFFGNILFNSNSELAQTSTAIEKDESLSPQKTKVKANQIIKKEIIKDAPKTTPLLKAKNNNIIASNNNISLKAQKPNTTTSNSPVKTNINPINSSVSKTQNSSIDNFASVEANILQPKNTKQHQKSTSLKEEPTSSETIKIEVQNQKTEEKSTVQKSNILVNTQKPPSSLEGSGMDNLVNNIEPVLSPRERKWEIGFNVGFNFPETLAGVYILTPDSTQVPGSNPFFPNETPVELYVKNYESTDLKKRLSPIFRLSVGREFRNSLLLRGGVILIRDSPLKKRTNNLLKSIPHEYAANFETSLNLWLFDIGIHLQPNRKRWRPFLGVSPLFTFLSQQKNSLKIYSADNEVVQKSTIYSGSDKGFNFTGFNIEGGMKYRITPKFEVGIQMFTIGTPFAPTQNGIRGRFTKPQFATSISYKL